MRARLRRWRDETASHSILQEKSHGDIPPLSSNLRDVRSGPVPSEPWPGLVPHARERFYVWARERLPIFDRTSR